MRTLVLPTVGITLAACASLDEAPRTVSPSYSAEGVSGEAVSYVDAADTVVEPDVVVDVSQNLEEAVVCRREAVLGSRIRRERCHIPLGDAEAILQEELTRVELERLRREAMREEQRHLERMGSAPPARPQPAPVNPRAD